MSTVPAALAQAKAFHRAGQLPSAEQIYRQILQVAPTNAEVHYLLGALLQTTGRLDAAVANLQQAACINPVHAETQNHLGLTLAQLGRIEEATACFERALRLRPDFADAQINLRKLQEHRSNASNAGKPARSAATIAADPLAAADECNRLGVGLMQQGKPGEAIARFQRALQLDPAFVEAYSNLGQACSALGKLDEAVACFSRVLQLKPDDVEALLNLGNAYKLLGKLNEAALCFRRTLELRPDFASAHNNLGNVFQDQGRLDEAVSCYRNALTIRPSYAGAHYNLGNALKAQGKLDEAIACYRQALTISPNEAAFHTHLGNALIDHGDIDEAIACYRQAIRLQPDMAEAYNNLGMPCRRNGKLDEAVACFRRAIELKPDCAEAYNNLAAARLDQGLIDEALASFGRAKEIAPASAEINAAQLAALNYHPTLDASGIGAAARSWANLLPPGLFAGRSYQNSRVPERRLRIGYASPHFQSCPDAHYLVPLLAAHDHRQFEIFAYSFSGKSDAVADRLCACCDQWHSMVGLPNSRAASLIAEHQIDILVNVSTHSALNCMLTMARKPAPIQVAWLVFASGSTGLPTIDYRISDPYLDPPGADTSFYVERTVRLPQTAWCYDPLGDERPVGPPPALHNGYVTFGCLNRLNKINDRVLAVWARILNAVPASRLLLLAHPGTHRQMALDRFRACGGDPQRVEFLDHASRPEYLRYHDRIDLILDCFPFGGHTTTLDALWMGVPVVTLADRRPVGHVGAGLLNNLGLKRLVAATPDDYVSIAVRAASDQTGLAALRGSLRSRLQSSPLMDEAGFARHLETAYRLMWRRYCSGESVAGFDVPRQ